MGRYEHVGNMHASLPIQIIFQNEWIVGLTNWLRWNYDRYQLTFWINACWKASSHTTVTSWSTMDEKTLNLSVLIFISFLSTFWPFWAISKKVWGHLIPLLFHNSTEYSHNHFLTWFNKRLATIFGIF